MTKVLKIVLTPFTLIARLVDNLRVSSKLRTLNINNIDKVNGVDFEKIMCYLFRKMKFKVDSTPVSGDYGADIILRKWGLTIAVQCKLYYNHSVGNKAVYEVHAGKGYYNADVAMVITNFKYSKPAQELAHKLNVILLDRTDVINMLERSYKDSANQLKKLIIINQQSQGVNL